MPSFKLVPIKNMMEDKTSIGTPMLVACIDAFGMNFLEWEPDTLILEAKATWGADLPGVNREKIWALVNILTTNLFYQNLECFISTCNVLSGTPASFENFDPADVTEMCWAVGESALIYPPEQDFGYEIKSYMLAQLESEGFSKPPRLLEKYVKMPDRSQEVSEIISGDGIETKSYWDSQQLKRLEVESHVRDRMYLLLETVAQLPLQHADREALSQLQERGKITLLGQQQESIQAAESGPRVPKL